MVGPVASQISKVALEQAKDHLGDKTQDAAEKSDVSRFDQAMKKGDTHGIQQGQPQPYLETPHDTPPGGVKGTTGDSILNKLSQMSGEFRKEGRQIVQDVDKPELSESDLIKAQLATAKLTTDETVTSETAGKVDKGVESLLRGD
ncbi:EscI/YscI/HrpB family type III secretion system inner rod protein [Desulfovibrio inopinatus]|uniref:EscI/YscI/HrpB family type III secretion system inner rod protein n=1 Tax=Desulfovibrio inopinatus TaxID=102109 RepID=UPI00042163B5|nr:EscI/YscI/HrpB family type III secretion system inner rod protein [Desulfovibrio inopinatus]